MVNWRHQLLVVDTQAEEQRRRADLLIRATKAGLLAEGISVTGRDGRTLRYICSFIDVTERRAQEAALADRAKFINDLLDSVPAAVAMRDLEGRFVFINRQFERDFDVNRTDMIGATPRERIHPDAAAAVEAMDRAALERGVDRPLESPDVSFGGRRYTQRRTVMADASGQPLGIIIASVDVTERRALEQELAARHSTTWTRRSPRARRPICAVSAIASRGASVSTGSGGRPSRRAASSVLRKATTASGSRR